MSSPTYCIDGIEGDKIVASWTTNNNRIAKKFEADFKRKYGQAAISKLVRIDQGVPVYAPMGGNHAN